MRQKSKKRSQQESSSNVVLELIGLSAHLHYWLIIIAGVLLPLAATAATTMTSLREVGLYSLGPLDCYAAATMLLS
jgi:hypothetical protein